MSQAILRLCQSEKLMTYPKGNVLLEQGSHTGTLYVLARGVIGISRGGVEVAQVSEPGAVFGETSVLLGSAHTATVQTKSQCDVYFFPDAQAFIKSNPDITYEIAAILAARLHRANDFITELNETARLASNIWVW
ncbi:Crp/Fnr family transcriptional regulator [Aestuariivirga litoralis]|uniref:Crp/Fnr family transcriptional regulator n=1 Tax=Aestuariivirga litoralis TaxID=2650924 RepID=UPI0018C70889|nr:Crp/Fnr family transcriptional regulator [Aestuariivirga litoralis]